MAKINFTIQIVTKDLSNLNKLSSQLAQTTNQIKNNFKGTGNSLGHVNAKIKVMNHGLRSAANNVGFMAFQFRFIAQQAFGAFSQIKNLIQSTVETGASMQDAVLRAIVASDVKINSKLPEHVEAVTQLNNAIRDLGAGGSAFNVIEVAEVFKEIGKAVKVTKKNLETGKEEWDPLVQAQATIKLSQEALKLMTIEEVDAEQAAKQLVRTMRNFNIPMKDIAKVTDVLVNVNRQSSASLGELLTSYGLAGQQAQSFGLTLQETGAFLGILQDSMGVQSGRAFAQMLVDMRSPAVALNPQLKSLGINILDAQGNLRDLPDIINEFAKASDVIKKKYGDIGMSKVVSMLKMDANAQRAFLALIEKEKDIKTAIEGASKEGTAAELAKVIEANSMQVQIKKIQSMVDSLKLDFALGMAPLIGALADGLHKFVRDPEIQDFFKTLGQLLAEELIPVFKVFLKLITKFIKFLNRNKGLLRMLIKGFIALTFAFLALGVIGTVISMVMTFVRVLMFLIPTMTLAGLGVGLLVGGLFILGAAIGAIVGWKLGEEITKINDAITNGAYEEYAKGIEGVYTWLQRIRDFLFGPDPFNSELWGIITKSVMGVGKAIQDFIMKGLGNIPSWVGEALNAAGKAFVKFFFTDLPNALTNLGSILKPVFEAAFKWFAGVKDYIWGLIAPQIKAISSHFQAIGIAIGNAIWYGVQTIIEQSFKLLEWLANAFGLADFYKWGLDLANTIWNGLMEGLNSLGGSIIEWFKNLLASMVWGDHKKSEPLKKDMGKKEENLLPMASALPAGEELNEITRALIDHIQKQIDIFIILTKSLEEENTRRGWLSEAIDINTYATDLNTAHIIANSIFYEALMPFQQELLKQTDIFNQQLRKSSGMLENVFLAFSNLAAAINAFAAGIKTIRMNNKGQFSWQGASMLNAVQIKPFQPVNAPTFKELQERAGPQITNTMDIVINVAGRADSDTIDELIARLEQSIADRVKNSSTLMR